MFWSIILSVRLTRTAGRARACMHACGNYLSDDVDVRSIYDRTATRDVTVVVSNGESEFLHVDACPRERTLREVTAVDFDDE